MVIQSTELSSFDKNDRLETTADNLVTLLSRYKFIIYDEKKLQLQIETILIEHGIKYSKEHTLNDCGIVDFFISGLAIEIKIKGRKKSIYKQCLDYCSHDEVDGLLLVTNMSMGMPEYLNGKACYVLSLGRAHL